MSNPISVEYWVSKTVQNLFPRNQVLINGTKTVFTKVAKPRLEEDAIFEIKQHRERLEQWLLVFITHGQNSSQDLSYSYARQHKRPESKKAKTVTFPLQWIFL